MFIEIQRRGKQKRYYLAHSFRFSGKSKKIRRYLGVNLSVNQLETLRIHAEKNIREQLKDYQEISDPFKTVLSSNEIVQLKSFKLPSTLKIFHLSEENWKEFTERFTYDTNAIEGSTVTLPQVKRIVENHEWPKGASKEDVSETYGVADAIDYIRKTKTHVSIELIKKLHSIVFKNSKSFAGKIRAKGTEVVVRSGSGEVVHRGASSLKVHRLLIELVEWYIKNRRKYPPIVLAAVAHNQFETIHPFQDGNGRVGRLLLSNILIKHKLPPVNVQLRNRGEYYAALQAYQHRGNIRPTIELILKEYQDMEKSLGKG